MIHAASSSPRPGDTNLSYFAGLFLKNRGETEKSNAYLVRCAQTPDYRKHMYAMACQMLRDLKIPVPAPNGPDVSDEAKDPGTLKPPINPKLQRAGRRR